MSFSSYAVFSGEREQLEDGVECDIHCVKRLSKFER